MAQSVRHVGDQVHVLPFLAAQQTIHRVDHHLDDVDVLPLVEAADVVRLGHLAVVENYVDGPCMVFHIQPVAHVLALAVHRQRLAVADVVDEQRDQLLRELVRTVVVRAVRHDGRHAVRVVEGTHKVVAARLAGAVRAVRVVLRRLVEELLAIGQVMLARRCLRGERRLDAFGVRHLQRAIHLVRRDVVEPLALVLLRQALPVQLRRLQQAQRTHHVRPCEGEGVLDASVHVALRRQMDDAVHLLLLHQAVEGVEVADVHLHELVVRFVFYIFQIGQIARIRQLVQVDNAILRILVHKQADHMAADETGSAGDYYGTLKC